MSDATEPAIQDQGAAVRVAPPAVKRARQQGTRRVRGKQGALKTVTTLPLDLVAEICGHLDVKELYALSNTNKAFRAIMVAELGKGLFRTARERIGMPELEASFGSDLRYAAWMFGRGCNICGKASGGKPDPSFRARICTACLRYKFVNHCAHDINVKLRDLNPFAPYFATPTTTEKGRGYYRWYLPDLERISDELDAKFPKTRDRALGACLRALWPLDDEDAYDFRDKLSLADFRALNLDWCYVQGVSRKENPDYDNPPAPNGEFQECFLARHNEMKVLARDTEALVRWMEATNKTKSRSNEELRAARRREIERRLQAVGFNESEFQAREFADHALVRSTRAVSDRSYPTTVEPVLRKVLEENRRERIRVALRKHLAAIRVSHPDKAYLPPPIIYCEFDSFASILDDVSRDPPANLIIPASTKAAAAEELRELVRDCRERLVRTIVSVYHQLAREKEDAGEVVDGDGDALDATPKVGKKFCLDTLPFTLPPLPDRAPTSAGAPLGATDAQLVAFLETSPLRYVQCAQGDEDE
ncbi:hypothetical protein JCM11491_001404 [Sporobolomyces phaffii]